MKETIFVQEKDKNFTKISSLKSLQKRLTKIGGLDIFFHKILAEWIKRRNQFEGVNAGKASKDIP
jgi:hypothetical protein